jgi:hypothetical protein
MQVPACFKTACTRDEACTSIEGLRKHQQKLLVNLGDRIVPEAKDLNNGPCIWGREQAAAKAGAGVAQEWLICHEWTFSRAMLLDAIIVFCVRIKQYFTRRCGASGANFADEQHAVYSPNVIPTSASFCTRYQSS